MSLLRHITPADHLLTLHDIPLTLAFQFQNPPHIVTSNFTTQILEDQPLVIIIAEEFFSHVDFIMGKVKEKSKKDTTIRNIQITIKRENYQALRESRFARWRYGMDIYDDQGCKLGYVKNLFGFKETFVCLCEVSAQQGEKAGHELIQVLDKEGVPLGIVFLYRGVNILVTYNLMFEVAEEDIWVEDKLSMALMNTCYLYNSHSYCTGILIADRKVVTVKHIMREEEVAVGYQLEVYLFPFKKRLVGKVSRIIDPLDAVEVELEDVYLERPKLKTHSEYSVGDKAIALGFGELNFGKTNLQDILFLPTISKGIISKSIQLNQQKCFIRFDGSLSRGFSGGGLWVDQQLIGMSVFNLKKRESELPRINFSYCISLLSCEVSPSIREFLKKASNNNITTRTTVPHLPRL